MDVYDVVAKAAKESGKSLRTISTEVGKASNHISNLKRQGSSPSVKNASLWLGACGYRLVAVPDNDVPPDALVID